jgi:hypothetical protein
MYNVRPFRKVTRKNILIKLYVKTIESGEISHAHGLVEST